MNKKYIVVTGGAGFIGSNLIKRLSELTKYKIISIDNYSSGYKSNHIILDKIKYINGDTKNISKILKIYEKKIHTIFHFGEFSRIYQSFLKFDKCLNSNMLGSKEVFNYCLKNKIKLIYSATSASLGKNNLNKNLSPYAYTKAKNLEFLENLKKWFNFKFEIIYFYNVYGNNHIKKGDMATVIAIFEDQYQNNKPLTVVKPGTQTRRFTHISDTIDVCFKAWKKNKCKHYSVSSNKNYSIIQIAKMFGGPIRFLSKRRGERYASVLTKMNLTNKIINIIGKKDIKNYINKFKDSINA